MFEAALAQLRFAASLVFGARFSLWALDRLVDALQASRDEFGSIGSEGIELLGGPTLDEADRREIQLRRFRQQAVRGGRETAYYAELFARAGLDPGRLTHDQIASLPLTPKAAIRDDPEAFLRRSVPVALRTTTTGTTGRPTEVCFSAHELRVTMLLGAINLLAAGRITSEDIVQINTSSRATLGNVCAAGAAARIGALVCPVGLVEPEVTLGLLATQRRIVGKKPQVSVMSTYPSYLAELVECGLRLGYRPADFGLERIAVGGEIVTEGLRKRSERLFGPVAFEESYGMTETWPCIGQRCPQGHLHFEPTVGRLEVLNPETARPAQPGEIGTMVATPFAPYREATVVLRYDTEDLVWPLGEQPDCSLRHLPGCSDVLGKRRLAVRHEHGWTCPRDVLEALEAVADVPLPARCGFWAAGDGVAVELFARADTDELRRIVARELETRGVPLRELRIVDDPRRLERPLPLRGDLRESSFRQRAEPAVPEGAPVSGMPGS